MQAGEGLEAVTSVRRFSVHCWRPKPPHPRKISACGCRVEGCQCQPAALGPSCWVPKVVLRRSPAPSLLHRRLARLRSSRRPGRLSEASGSCFVWGGSGRCTCFCCALGPLWISGSLAVGHQRLTHGLSSGPADLLGLHDEGCQPLLQDVGIATWEVWGRWEVRSRK